MNGWDVVLIVAVTAMVTIMAMLRTPRRKALVLAFPVPFTIASLAVGRPVDASHVAALPVLFLYTLGVWVLHRRLGVRLPGAIVVAAAGFVAIAAGANRILPRTEANFWWLVAGTALLAAVLLATLPVRDERGPSRDLPLALKIPLALLTVVFLVWIKDLLGGFMTLFPMVGVLASYENRFGLWSNLRQIPVVMLTMLPLMVTSHMTVGSLGLAASLAVGWVPFTAVLLPFLVRGWRGAPAGPRRAMGRTR